MDAFRTSMVAGHAALDDEALVARIQAGDREAFRQLIRRCNQRLYRVVRGVIRDEAEAEDVVQAAYVHAYEKIDGYRGEASVATWLCRIALNEAYGRLRGRRRTVDIERLDAPPQASDRVVPFPGRADGADPVAEAARDQLRRLLERAVDALPEPFRMVFLLREVEGCSVAETAAALDLREETVKTRLHRARRQLREALHEEVAMSLSGAFPFLGARCDRITDAVMARLDEVPLQA